LADLFFLGMDGREARTGLAAYAGAADRLRRLDSIVPLVGRSRDW